jgi:DNA-binding beta-propeller fold protein YncE
MNTGTLHKGSRRMRVVKGLLLQAVTTALVTACGGGGYGDDGGNAPAPPPPPPAAAVIRDAQFTDDTVSGLRFSVTGVGEGVTSDVGKFQFAEGRKVDFLLGSATNRIVVGSATPGYTASGLIPFSLQDLDEVRAANGDAYLSNLLRLLILLDANNDSSDGFQVDATATNAVAAAVTGTKTLDFAASAATFDGDATVVALATALNRTLVSADEALVRYQLLFRQSRSSSIALTSDDNRAVVVNRQKASVSVIRVRNTDGSDASQLLAEIPVGREPRFVAIAPNDSRAYVTSAIDGTMSVIDLTASTPVALGSAIDVGVEPRGIAVTPNGTYAFIAGHTTGDVAVVRLSNYEVAARIHTGGNPYAIAISNDGDTNDNDERVYVTQLFGDVIDPARPDGFDDAKQGVVSSFRVGDAVTNAAAAPVSRLLLKPMLSGFNADRRNFCPLTRSALEIAGTVKYFNSGPDGSNGTGAAQLAKTTFCPDVASANIDPAGPIGRVVQKTYPNMLFGALLRGPFLYVPNVGAQPEPPVNFNTNVQALVGVLGSVTNAETPFSVNLNTYVLKEPAPATPTASLDKLFLNDIVAIDADRRGRDFLVVSRGGNYVIRASVGTDGKLTTLDANNTARRFQTGNLPSGVVMARSGLRAYVNNELNTSMSVLNLADNTVITRDVESSAPPAPGTQAHRNLVGKLAFFTALGVPDKLDTTGDGQFDVALRDINPLANRGKASNNGWSGCASCHDDGHADNVTWIFETGPRQTIPLEGTFARNNLNDQRILNWSAVRGSNTDFNNNARGIQGGVGFATNVDGVDKTSQVFNHGPTRGISDSLDAMSEWVATVRAPIMPAIAANTEANGRAVFTANCASCHGGAKWTKSRTAGLYLDNPLLQADPVGPAFFNGGPLKNDAGVNLAGPQVVSVTRAGKPTFLLLDNVGTFNVTSPIEIRGAAAVNGQTTQGFLPFGGGGFNSPSLLGVAYSGPYFHDGSSHTLEDVAARHRLGDAPATIASTLSVQDLADLLSFVRSIDDGTATMPNATDAFIQ